LILGPGGGGRGAFLGGLLLGFTRIFVDEGVDEYSGSREEP
jgi:hypothetical protein